MRKIYPPHFNKFAVLVLYGLLSIAAVTLAQVPKQNVLSNCMPQPMASTQKKLTIGYIQFFTNQASEITPDKIPWDSYDYINIIAYPNDPKGPWNSIRHPTEPSAINALSQIQALKDAKKVGSTTEFLLSIRNYDPVQWPDDEATYNQIIIETVQTITTFGLSGVDIEYPGLRAIECNVGGWGKDDKPKKDANFVSFIGRLRTGIGKDKTLMITAGREFATGLGGYIDYLNIEAHPYSLYENLRKHDKDEDPKIGSHPNSPLTEIENAYKQWNEKAGIDGGKILVGVDFGNTFQIVPNVPKGITISPEVEFDALVDDQNQLFNPVEDPVIDGITLKRINHCPQANPIDRKLYLYSFPWKDLSTSILDQNSCNATKNKIWTHNFDENRDEKSSMTPWLYRKEEDSDNYQFISYEDPYSIQKKLERSAIGVSISDISYDDSDNSLIKFITGKITKATPGGSSGTGTSSKVPSNSPKTTNPANETQISGSSANMTTDGGKIAGGVVGGFIGLFVLGLLGFIGYRYRKERPKSISTFLKSLPNRRGFSSSGNHGALSEMASDTTNHRVINDPATVIPIASGYVTAMFDFTGKEENDLSFKKGDKIEVLERGDGPNDWWVGRVNGAVGEFPGNYVKDT